MPAEVLKSDNTVRSDRFAQKARILLDLFGPTGLERLQGAGLDPGVLAALENAAETAPQVKADIPDGREGLIRKFRDKGLFNLAQPTVKSRSNPEVISGLGQRIAEHLQDGALERENPAVIAYVLRSQPKSVQARVLRALPGTCARATIQHMKR